MLNSLNAIKQYKAGHMSVLKTERWLLYLGLTRESNINMERISSLEELRSNYVLDYVERSLLELDHIQADKDQRRIIEDVLKWSEVAKCGLPHLRKKWLDKGYNLFVHNVGSSQIYMSEACSNDTGIHKVVYTLINTHGLVGQYLRGEVSLEANMPLTALIDEGVVEETQLRSMLHMLNRCVISAVSAELWRDIENDILSIIELIVSGNYHMEYSLKQRLQKLRSSAVINGENFELEFDKQLTNSKIKEAFNHVFKGRDLWFVEAALYDFSFEEFVKIFMLVYSSCDINTIKHISFESMMKELYYDHENKKRVNIYKKRIIEKFLSELSIEDILNRKYPESSHIKHEIKVRDELDDTAFFNFKFSPAAAKLIEFCTEAEKSDVLYERAIILLFDLFGFRKDAYDRFYEEEKYLSTMNQSVDHKRVILNFIKGSRVLDIGPGGGAIMDLIEERYPEKKITGIDISENVIDTLKKKKQLEKHEWDVLQGDALNLAQYLQPGSIDTIIYCSIMHELFSYIEFNGSKFNHETLAAALKSAFEVLSEGGRIIIRDGIMTEPMEQRRIIKFLSEEGIDFLKRYVNDFQGRKIQFDIIGHNEVIMPVNDAMEFLYTYTWGEKSYVHEVNEQFGYFTPSEFKRFIHKTLGDKARLVEFRHYLQDGYSIALSQKIEFFDEQRSPVRLPDSTCLVVIEKDMD